MSLLSSLLDPGFRQAASVQVRMGLAAVDLPADLAALVNEIEIMLGRSEAATGRLTFDDRRKEDGQWMVADSPLFARWEKIEIHADFETHTEEVFRGYVTVLTPNIPQNGGEATLTLEIQDDGVALNREQMRRVWGEDAPISDRDILSELVAPLNLSVSGESHDGQSSRALNMDATPIQFLRERARASGFEMIIREGEVYFGPMRLTGDPQTPINVLAGSATNCLQFGIQDQAQKPDAVAFEIAPRDEGGQPVTEIVFPDQPLLGATAAGAEGAGLPTDSIWRLSRDGDEPEETTRAKAQALANENSFKVRASGELDGTLYGHVLKPGLLVSVDGVGTRNGGLYYVDKVTHKFTSDGYRQSFEIIRNATGETDTLGAAPLSNALSAISSLF